MFDSVAQLTCERDEALRKIRELSTSLSQCELALQREKQVNHENFASAAVIEVAKSNKAFQSHIMGGKKNDNHKGSSEAVEALKAKLMQAETLSLRSLDRCKELQTQLVASRAEGVTLTRKVLVSLCYIHHPLALYTSFLHSAYTYILFQVRELQEGILEAHEERVASVFTCEAVIQRALPKEGKEVLAVTEAVLSHLKGALKKDYE